MHLSRNKRFNLDLYRKKLFFPPLVHVTSKNILKHDYFRRKKPYCILTADGHSLPGVMFNVLRQLDVDWLLSGPYGLYA